MVDKLVHDAKIYSDITGLERLRYQSQKDPASAKKEVSQQFEALFVQILLKSMRDANKAFSSELFGGDQMEMYQDMFDKQLSLAMSNSGIGLAAQVEKNIDMRSSTQLASDDMRLANQIPSPIPMTSEKRIPKSKVKVSLDDNPTPTQEVPIAKEMPAFDSQESFIKSLWSSAKEAAKMLGTDPRILLAQAALETNWGKKIISDFKTSTHNLFNIKADNAWKHNTVTTQTLEQKNGLLVKENANFRSYHSFNDSFMDYVQFLKSNTRYAKALDKAQDPKQFTYALQDAGFATDNQYAEKVLSIFSSNSFKNIVNKLE